MNKTVYDKQAWRSLPRDYCVVDHLLGDAVGPCRGLIHHHHVDPTDPDSRTVQVCAAHHSQVHGVLRGLGGTRHKTCRHRHPTIAGREACERRLNRVT